MLECEYHAKSFIFCLNSRGDGGDKVPSVPFGHTPVTT